MYACFAGMELMRCRETRDTIVCEEPPPSNVYPEVMEILKRIEISRVPDHRGSL
jgi:hypothetical protein